MGSTVGLAEHLINEIMLGEKVAVEEEGVGYWVSEETCKTIRDVVYVMPGNLFDPMPTYFITRHLDLIQFRWIHAPIGDEFILDISGNEISWYMHLESALSTGKAFGHEDYSVHWMVPDILRVWSRRLEYGK